MGYVMGYEILIITYMNSSHIPILAPASIISLLSSNIEQKENLSSFMQLTETGAGAHLKR